MLRQIHFSIKEKDENRNTHTAASCELRRHEVELCVAYSNACIIS